MARMTARTRSAVAYSHKKAAAAVKRGHSSSSAVFKGSSGSTASYPSKNSGRPYNNLSVSAPAPTRWGGSGRGH